MYSFKKKERLTSKKEIEKLFTEGNCFFIYPLKIYWIISDSDMTHPAQVLISVSKRNFKKAVTRNILKRRIREAYRLNKNLLYKDLQDFGLNLCIAFIYTAGKISLYKEIEASMIASIEKIILKTCLKKSKNI